jgi:hypothetical protein
MTTVRAQRFLEAFLAAVHDVELEKRGYRLYHFFDSDALIRLIFGFRDPLNHALILESRSQDVESEAAQKLLMGALVGQGIGAPPNMRALPPHLYEVHRAVGRPWSPEARTSLALTIGVLEIEERLSGLVESLREDATDAVLERLLEYGPQIFYGVELLSGGWESRLGRVLWLGIREPSPFEEEPEMVGTEAFDVLARHVGQVGDDRHHSPGVSGLRDAMALAALARGISEARNLEPPFDVARFYTETPRIHRAWRRSGEFRALLTYDLR